VVRLLQTTSTRFPRLQGASCSTNTNETRWGAAVGVGIEYAFAPNWSIGFEYDHLFMGNKDVNDGFLVVDHIKEDIDIFTARVNYKFGGPVVARY
jgi:outer membrane immunogenic protein